MKHIRIEHETHYNYQTDVLLAQHLGYLRVRDSTWQKRLSSEVSITPEVDSLHEDTDVFGNSRLFFTLTHAHQELTVIARSEVQKRPRYAGFDPARTPAWDAVQNSMRYSLEQPYVPASEFVWPSPYVPWLSELRDYALPSFTRGEPIAMACLDLNHRIFKDFSYVPGVTEIHTPLAQAFVNRHGVCQDFSHIMIGCLRAMGLAARYVSGYLLTTPAPGQVRLRGADASHAWISVYCPGAPGDWLELDPTNDTIADMAHVCLATGRDFGDVSPLRGVIRGGGVHTLRIAVTSEELIESGATSNTASKTL